jgi:hypothetical protein
MLRKTGVFASRQELHFINNYDTWVTMAYTASHYRPEVKTFMRESFISYFFPSLIHLSVHSSIHYIYLFIYSIIHSFIYSLNLSCLCSTDCKSVEITGTGATTTKDWTRTHLFQIWRAFLRTLTLLIARRVLLPVPY